MIVSMQWHILSREYRERHKQKLWLTLAGLFVFVATLTLVFFGGEIAAHVHQEVFKLLAQLVILAGIGGLGHMILTEINTSRERRDAKRTLLRTALSDIVGVYNEVKRGPTASPC
jgi:undecaprenyl pyrophosphate phosphatase UppP